MKHISKLLLLAILVVFASCQQETLNDAATSIAEYELALENEILVSDGEEDETFVLNENSDIITNRKLSSSKASYNFAGSTKVIKQEYKTINLDRCDYPDGLIANFWWPTTPTTYDSGHFSSNEADQLKFTTYTDGTAKISGQTRMGTCLVDVNVWLNDKMDWDTFSSPINGGSHKDEDNDCTDIDPTILDYYVIDSSKSSITATGGDCLEEGTFGIEQRPDPENANDGDPSTLHLGALVGKGAGLFDAANKDMDGLSTWGWITKDGVRKWIMDFNFNIEPIEEPCSDCEGKVTDLELEFDWHYAKRVKIYQKKENTCYGVKIFDKTLQPGEKFTIKGANNDGSIGSYAYIYINHCYYTKIKTNCDINIGPGYTKGVFNVISGESSNGGELCEYVKPDYNKCYRHWSCRYYSKCRYSYGGH